MSARKRSDHKGGAPSSEVYRMWHQRDVQRVQERKFTFPEEVVCVGAAKRIIYLSDKWQNPGDGELYMHDFDSEPGVFMAAKGHVGEGLRLPTAGLLCVDSVDDEITLPVLATVQEFSYRGEDRMHTMVFRTPPTLCSTADKLVLVFLREGDPIFVFGGKMRVTRRGIVH